MIENLLHLNTNSSRTKNQKFDEISNPGLSSDKLRLHYFSMLHRLLNIDSFQTTEDALFEIKKGMSNAHKITSWTHNLYKYPACFPATFPKSILNSFSRPNDWILDPFVGGGTSAVEALVSGRNFIGTDINELAIFSSRLKTTLISNSDARIISDWSEELTLARTISECRINDEIYFTNVPKIIELLSRKILTATRDLPGKKLQCFAKGALLRLGQLEVEQRLTITDIKHAEELFKSILFTSLHQARNLHKELQKNFVPDLEIHLANAGNPEVINTWNSSNRPFNLVLTSPPYPERHILYNKWQVKGRSETRLPYWIIESDQVESESFYTMSPRESDASLEIYITNMLSVFENLNVVMEKNGVFVQVIAFSDVERQLPVYLDAMNEAGFDEIKNIDTSSFDGRLWRDVPNRKWFNRIDSARQCKEVILFHRKAKSI